jgi:hypothetical protein
MLFEKPEVLLIHDKSITISFNQKFHKGIRKHDHVAYASWNFSYVTIGVRPNWFQRFSTDWYDGHDLNYIIIFGLLLGWGSSYTYDTF